MTPFAGGHQSGDAQWPSAARDGGFAVSLDLGEAPEGVVGEAIEAFVAEALVVMPPLARAVLQGEGPHRIH